MRVAAIFLSLILIGACSSANSAVAKKSEPASAPEVSSSKDTSKYAETTASINSKRKELAKEYVSAADKKASLNKARNYFISSLEKDVVPFWYGTEWDFYGMTEKPKEGKIACGYFVTTVLRDVGLKVERAPLAQQASENIIKSLTSAPYIKRYHNASIDKFVEGVKANGEGLYIVGLDFHVGFILNDGNEVYFIHSSYAEPKVVMREKALESAVLASSKYRVTGKISGDDSLILKWLNQTRIPTIRR